MSNLNKIPSSLIALAIFSASYAVNAAEIISADELIKQLGVSQKGLTRSLGGQSFGAKPVGGRANMSAIQFEYNSAELTQQGRMQVKELATAIKALGSDAFQVVGHTDASGSDQYNLTLSQRRAKSVYTSLVNEHGIDEKRLQAVGKGETALIEGVNPNAAENRRVEAINTRVLQ